MEIVRAIQAVSFLVIVVFAYCATVKLRRLERDCREIVDEIRRECNLLPSDTGNKRQAKR